jgi:CheY-like chemotaxis protein
VDDDEHIGNMARQMITRLGYSVVVMSDPEDALELFASESGSFSAVITDMTMPKFSGIHFAQEIKKIRKDIPIVGCSGYHSQIDEENAGALGFAAYVMKPITRSQISTVLHDVLES